MHKPQAQAPESYVPVLFMCGISGSGKTRYALGLESQGYRRLSLDAYNTAGLGTAELDRDLEELIRRGVPVVVDSTMCKRARRDAVRELCRRCDARAEFVYLHAPLEVLRERLSHRRNSGPDDLIVSDAEVEFYYAHFEVPAADETDVLRPGD